MAAWAALIARRAGYVQLLRCIILSPFATHGASKPALAAFRSPLPYPCFLSRKATLRADFVWLFGEGVFLIVTTVV
jgi:hypothetical protein